MLNNKLDLQQFSAPKDKVAVAGKDIVYLYRLLKNQSKAGAERMAFTTENSNNKTQDADTTATKDGTIRVPGQAEIEITSTSLLVKGDTMIADLEAAMDTYEVIEIWEANLSEPATDGPENTKFKGTYYQGYLTSLEKTSNSDGHVELSFTFSINGKGAKGDVTVTKEQQEAAAYVFTDTTQTA